MEGDRSFPADRRAELKPLSRGRPSTLTLHMSPSPASASWLPAKEADRDEQAEDAPRRHDGQVSPLESGAGRVRIPGREHRLEEVADGECVGEVDDTVGKLILGNED